jgi:hypothetical protein
MSYWKENEIRFGNVKQGNSKTVTFEGLPDQPEIKEMEAYCGCTSLKYDSSTKTLTVTYKAGNIPAHIQGNQVIDSRIDIHYTNGETEQLAIKGLKIRT